MAKQEGFPESPLENSEVTASASASLGETQEVEGGDEERRYEERRKKLEELANKQLEPYGLTYEEVSRFYLINPDIQDTINALQDDHDDEKNWRHLDRLYDERGEIYKKINKGPAGLREIISAIHEKAMRLFAEHELAQPVVNKDNQKQREAALKVIKEIDEI